MDKPIVAIVGRPNVGKSTLVNRIISAQQAIVHHIPGVTRDRNYIDATWSGIKFVLVDTGGIEIQTSDPLLQQVKYQAEIAIKEADVIILLCDGQEGILPTDIEIIKLLKRSNKPVILGVNKIDNIQKEEEYIAEFYGVGIDEIIGISSLHGLNINTLLDKVVTYLPQVSGDDIHPSDIAIAVVGKPNVGKSSLINAILKQDRVLVDDIPGTTRDTIDTSVIWNSKHIILIDTAGIRKKQKISRDIEKYSVLRALKAIERANVSILMIDFIEGLTSQDQKILAKIERCGCGCVIAINKWDLRPKNIDEEILQEEYKARVRHRISYVDYVPIIFISAIQRYGINKLLNIVEKISMEHNKWIPTGKLNRIIEKAYTDIQPPATRGKYLKIFYATQIKVKPPTFVLFVNHTELLTDSYSKYLIRKLRDIFGFYGTPVKLIAKRR
jgi:GTP-binding protein